MVPIGYLNPRRNFQTPTPLGKLVAAGEIRKKKFMCMGLYSGGARWNGTPTL